MVMVLKNQGDYFRFLDRLKKNRRGEIEIAVNEVPNCRAEIEIAVIKLKLP